METTTHTAVPAEHRPFPPFERETFGPQLFWLAVTFVVLYMVMARVGLPRVGAIIAARATRIEEDAVEANRLTAAANAESDAYEKAMADARAGAHAIAAETRDRTAAEANATRKRLDAELSERLGDAERQIAETKRAALSNVRGIARDAAGTIVAQLIGTTPPADEIEAALDAAPVR